MKKNHTTLILIFSIIATLLTVCLFVFFLKVIKNKNQHTSVALTTLENKIKEKENAALFAEKITEIKSIQDSVNNHFVDPDKIDTFVGYLEDLGTSVGSRVMVENIEVPPKTNNLILIKLSIDGTFQSVIKTINLLENIPYQTNINQVYLNKEIKQSVVKLDEKGQIIKDLTVKDIPTWQASVSFNIVSLK